MAKKIPVKTKIKTRNKLNQLKADVFNTLGEKTGKIDLPAEFFASKISPKMLAQSVRVYLSNQRSGTRKVKTRSEVSHSGRKIYRQKGTGRARHGDIKAPIFIGGGVAHGPKPKKYHLKISKSMIRKSLGGALTHKYQSDAIKFISGLDKFPPKTKKMINFMTALKILQKKQTPSSLLLITEKLRPEVVLSARNIPFMSITPVQQLNSYQVLSNKILLMEKNALLGLPGKNIKNKN